MKKRLFLLKAIDAAAKSAFVLLLCLFVHFAVRMAEDGIGVVVMIAALGGIIAAGRWLYNFLLDLEEIIRPLEKAVRRQRDIELFVNSIHKNVQKYF